MSEKPKYSPPQVIELGEMARGTGLCAAGSSAPLLTPDLTCVAGGSDISSCSNGLTAAPGCVNGTNAP